MKISFPVSLTAADSNRRIISGRIVSWNEEGSTSAGRTMFRNQSDGVWKHRYSKGGSDYTIDTYKSAVSTRGSGVVGEEPEWLRTVLDIAALGGHGMTMPQKGPPDYVLWFETDPNLRLLKMVYDFEDTEPEASFTYLQDRYDHSRRKANENA